MSSNHPSLRPEQVPDEAPVMARLPVLDRFLPVWIVLAMLLGLALGAAGTIGCWLLP